MDTSESGRCTFVFADISGFTALTEAHGDEEALELAAEFFERVAEILPEHSSEQVKTIGDAVMVRSEDPAEAVRLGVRIVHELGTRSGFPTVRVGLHTGDAVEQGGDWFGATVNLAARVSGIAAGGEVLLTEATREDAGSPSGVHLREAGRRQLKNIREPVQIYEARPEGARADDGLPIDPVCRMAVDPDECAGWLSYQGVDYHFCSLRCATAFGGAPEAYARVGGVGDGG